MGPTPNPLANAQTMGKSNARDGHPQIATNPKEVEFGWERSWGEAYLTCPTWKEKWLQTQSEGEWPEGVQVFSGQMFLKGKQCVPLCFQREIIQQHHEFLLHVSSESG